MGTGVLDEKHLHSSRLNKQVLWVVHNHLPDLVPDLRSVESFVDVYGHHVGRFVAVIDSGELAAHHFEFCLELPVVDSLLPLGGQLY